MSGRLPAVLVPLLLVGTLAVGCGDGGTETEPSPLAARLAQIDGSLAERRFEQARRDLAALAADVKVARAEGELSSARADAILDAVVALRATLPEPAPTPTPTTTSAPTVDDPSAAPQPRSPGKDEPAKKRPGKGKGR